MLRALRIVGLIEGTSFLVLLLIAMPLKRIWGIPQAVQIVGSAHGGLFILYLFLGWSVGRARQWPLKRYATLILASGLPLGTFVFDANLKKEEALETNAS